MARQSWTILYAGAVAMPCHTRQMKQDCKSGRSLNQCANGRAVKTNNEITFPVAGNAAIISRRGPFAYHDIGPNESFAVATDSCPGHSKCSTRAQARDEFASQGATSLHIQRLINAQGSPRKCIILTPP